jgi:16S rRNA processing protein RimM
VTPDAGWVAIALLGKTRGIRGEVTARMLGGKPERYRDLGEVHLAGGPPGCPERLEVESTWFHSGTLIFKFRGVDSMTDAERLAGAEVRVPLSQRVTLDPGEFFLSDLEGCQVVDRRTGDALGRITGWEDAGGSGLLVVDGAWTIPFVRSLCVEIEPAARRIAVELPEGLKDLNRT